ncbi:MAG: ubiquinone/menaquinone biosynthesis C-methylase UbiE [Paraglaciecola sp.]|jgi:ubiquinone/menaquinone biosynthesis C-methylase UbiE
MSTHVLYTDLSGYYDLLCSDIDYPAQSAGVHRLHELFGNRGKKHLDLACGTGPHIRHFLDYGYQSSGLDINQPMLDRAKRRCPEAHFSKQDICAFTVDEPVDMISCFLYSIHYSGNINQLKACIASVHNALTPGGLFCFNAVDKRKIDNHLWVTHSAAHDNCHFVFNTAWYYSGQGDQQLLKLSIEKTSHNLTQTWQDEHPMVATDFAELEALLHPYFTVHILTHDYDKILPWDKTSGNALFVCMKN